MQPKHQGLEEIDGYARQTGTNDRDKLPRLKVNPQAGWGDC